MQEAQVAWGNAMGSLATLGVHAKRVTGSLVGRPLELTAIQRALSSAERGLACVALEGEPGIGKTRLLLAIEELARGRGFCALAVTADEEIRGPLLVARSIFGSAAVEATPGSAAQRSLERVVDALLSVDDPGLESLGAERRLVRTFDLAAVALRALAAERPVALLVDDVQWADEDSLRLLRYVVRSSASSRLLLVLATRPEEVAFVNEAVTLMADLDRMGLLDRLRLNRFTQMESADFLQQALGGPVHPSTAATMHAQAEGVPFILAEQARSYRDAGMVQRIDGVWTLAKNAERLLPSAVRTLIQRRAGRLPDEAKALLGEAAVLGRSFSLRDLRDVRKHLDGEDHDADALAEVLSPAVTAGLLVQHAQGSRADYTFMHELVRDYASGTLTQARKRAIHGAIVHLLTAGGDPPPASLPLLARHALAAGQAELSARFSVEAARAALQAHAPEETLRLVALAQPVATSVPDRIALLCLQDDALSMLRRPAARLEGLAQLAALAEALADSRLELEVILRRAAALRLSRDFEGAAELARRARRLAAEREDPQMELAACLELGQDLLRTEIGEAYVPAISEVDVDATAEAFGRAAVIAEQLGDEASLAAATRELGVIGLARVRGWFVEQVKVGEHVPILRRIAAGERFDDIVAETPIAPTLADAMGLLQRALDLYERIGDKRGAMATIIAMAYISWGVEIHFPGSAKRIEEIRRLAGQMKSLTKESERALADAQMLYGAHVYARAKVFPDTAVLKGEEAYRAARGIGDRGLEFAAAGGTALACADLGALDVAEHWLSKAAEVASEEPTPLRARQLELWRGMVRGAAGDADGMREHLERAAQLAAEQGRPAARTEALTGLAVQAARLGAQRQDHDLLALAEQAAREAKDLMPTLPGKPLWGAEADAALARVALARGATGEAVTHARTAMRTLDTTMSEDLYLDILLPAAAALQAGGTEKEASEARDNLSIHLTLLAQRFSDDDARVQWFRGAVGSELTKLAGPAIAPTASPVPGASVSLSEEERRLLRLLTEAHTNKEIAAELGISEKTLGRQLADLFAKIGASSRSEAAVTAYMGRLV